MSIKNHTKIHPSKKSMVKKGHKMAIKNIDIESIETLIKNAELGKEIKLLSIKPYGSLVIFRRQKYFVFFWRIYINGKPKKIKIGVFDSKLSNKILYITQSGTVSILGAIRQAEKLASIHQEYIKKGGYLAYLEQEKESNKKLAAINDKKKTIVENPTPLYTLSTLIKLYISEFKELKQRQMLTSIFKKHVLLKSPEIVNKSIESVKIEDITELLQRTYRAETPTVVVSIRAYLLAMIRKAIKAKINVTINPEYKNYNISNELQNVPPLGVTTGRADKNPLSEKELWTYYQVLDCIDVNYTSVTAKAWHLKRLYLKLHLLLGGQRMAQLLRLRYSEINEEEQELILHDTKGRGGLANKTIKLPITKQIKKILDDIKSIQAEYIDFNALQLEYKKNQQKEEEEEEKVKDYVFTHYGRPDVRVKPSTFAIWSKKAIGKSIKNFKLKRVRSGVETLMASMNVSRELRGVLQSHGNTGIQEKHYNGYSYIRELKIALDGLFWHVSNNEFVSVVNRDKHDILIDSLIEKFDKPIKGYSDTERAILKTSLSTFRTQITGAGIVLNMLLSPNNSNIVTS